MKNNKINVKGLELNELEEFVSQWDEPSYRARQLILWLYHKRATEFELMTDISKSFRQILNQHAYISRLNLIERKESNEDATIKFLFELEDGNRIESVLMFDADRITVCVSTQVGCAQGCKFCATGKMGFVRNLTAAEIIDQIMTIEDIEFGHKAVTNVVFMGMGEPLANYENSLKALRLMFAPEGLMISARKITLSTSGLVPQIKKFTNEGLKTGLALSLNAPIDKLRNKIMPINRIYSIKETLEACRNWTKKVGRKVTIEYVLIKDVNDNLDYARLLCKIMHDIPTKFNLIPFNEVNGIPFKKPSPERVEEFRKILASRYYIAPIRISKGKDISAACGQLRTNVV